MVLSGEFQHYLENTHISIQVEELALGGMLALNQTF